MTPGPSLSIDIHCRVIDNYGDAGVTFRLARRWAAMGHQCRLWVDDRQALSALWTGDWPSGVSVLDWDDERPCGDVVIEAFGCSLPSWRMAQIQRMRSGGRPVWINLEYLSAEPWVDGIHGLPSPDPESGVIKSFFCPGFTPTSGGIASSDVGAVQGAASNDPVRSVFVFAYPAAKWADWIDAWRRLGVVQVNVAAPDLQHSEASACPWVPQDQFDSLLNAHDVVVVRGEDSFVRAQLLGIPMLWHIYPTKDMVHLAKMHAWLNRYLVGVPRELGRAVRSLHSHLNDPINAEGDLECLWREALDLIGPWRAHARAWSGRLRSQQQCPDLATSLVEFCWKRLQ